MSDQDIISPYNINAVSSRQVMRIRKKVSIRGLFLIQYQISKSIGNIMRIVWQAVRRIPNKIWEWEG